MANLEPMPISSLPEGTVQDGDKMIVYRDSTGKAYQSDTSLLVEAESVSQDVLTLQEDVSGLKEDVAELNADLTDVTTYSIDNPFSDSSGDVYFSNWSCTINKVGRLVTIDFNCFVSAFPTTSSSTTLFTLPSDCRPISGINHTYIGQSSSKPNALLGITTGGNVTLAAITEASGAWNLRQHIAYIARD